MSVLRKEQMDEKLTTADLAQGAQPTPPDERRSKLVEHEPVSTGSAEELEARRPMEAGLTLFPGKELAELRRRWDIVQTAFVDEPRSAVERADGLVAAAMKRLAEVFAEERSQLERQWDQGDKVSTEDLRIALQRYRTFFQRLLSI